MTTDKSNQGRTHEVEHDPDGWGIALQFYGWVSLVVAVIGFGVYFGGAMFAAGALCGAVLVFLLACFALGAIAP
jgi:hypothetical protein